jgi:hypothetical protein
MKSCCLFCAQKGNDRYGYVICDSCTKKLGLSTDKAIQRYVAIYKKTKKHSFKQEVRDRLVFIEKEYAKKRIKLLHIQERLKGLE